MSTLQTRSHTAIVASIAQGMQGRVSAFMNFAVGSFLRAIAESYAGQALWLQFLALQIQLKARLATSFGSDVDSFVADWPLAGVERGGAQAGTTLCTFGRNTAGPSTVYVPVGGQVKTLDGSQTYQVYADPTNTAYVASYTPAGAAAPIGGYIMQPQIGSVLAPVQALAPGSAGNVAAGQIALLASSMPSIDTVTNPGAVVNGIDEESDASVKARFALAVQGRSGGTAVSITSAIANVGVGMQSQILDGQDYSLADDPGMVTVIVDDGSGDIPPATLASATAAVNAVRAAGIRVGVYPAVVTPITVSMTVASATGFIHSSVTAQVAAAIGSFIDGAGLGQGISYFETARVAAEVSGVSNILSYTLNGGVSDVPPNPLATPKIASPVIN